MRQASETSLRVETGRENECQQQVALALFRQDLRSTGAQNRSTDWLASWNRSQLPDQLHRNSFTTAKLVKFLVACPHRGELSLYAVLSDFPSNPDVVCNKKSFHR